MGDIGKSEGRVRDLFPRGDEDNRPFIRKDSIQYNTPVLLLRKDSKVQPKA